MFILNQTRLYPGWKNAIQIIRDRVKEQGYGFLIKMDEFMSMMDLEIPQGNISFEESRKFQGKLASYINQVSTTLLECHQICLENVWGEGYQVLTPKNQVISAPYKHIRNARKELGKARDKLVNVPLAELDNETKRERHRLLAQLQFIDNSFIGKQLTNDNPVDDDNKLPLVK